MAGMAAKGTLCDQFNSDKAPREIPEVGQSKMRRQRRPLASVGWGMFPGSLGMPKLADALESHTKWQSMHLAHTPVYVQHPVTLEIGVIQTAVPLLCSGNKDKNKRSAHGQDRHDLPHVHFPPVAGCICGCGNHG